MKQLGEDVSHAENDEVLIVVMAGSVELRISEEHSEAGAAVFVLSAAGEGGTGLCAAYLPPGAAYRLIPREDADVAYARATPTGGRSPMAFSSQLRSDGVGVSTLFEEATYAERRRVRLSKIDASQDAIDFMPIHGSEDACEALVHVATLGSEWNASLIDDDGAEVIPLAAWDTIAAMPGERPTLRVGIGSSALLLVVRAI